MNNYKTLKETYIEYHIPFSGNNSVRQGTHKILSPILPQNVPTLPPKNSTLPPNNLRQKHRPNHAAHALQTIPASTRLPKHLHSHADNHVRHNLHDHDYSRYHFVGPDRRDIDFEYDDPWLNSYYLYPIDILNSATFIPDFASPFIQTLYQQVLLYPQYPSPMDMTDMINFINSIPNIIPCYSQQCKDNAYNYIANAQNNINFICSSQQNVNTFIHKFINYMNPYVPEMRYVEDQQIALLQQPLYVSPLPMPTVGV